MLKSKFFKKYIPELVLISALVLKSLNLNSVSRFSLLPLVDTRVELALVAANRS